MLGLRHARIAESAEEGGCRLETRDKNFAKKAANPAESRQDRRPNPSASLRLAQWGRNTGGRSVPSTGDIFVFEEFRLDRQGEGLSWRDQRGVFVPVSIGLRALDVLRVLVERSGDLVTKEEIIAAVWGRTVVENANLTVQISALRRVLDEGRAEGSCIQTVAARGYRFVAQVTRMEHATAAGDGNIIRELGVSNPGLSDKPSVVILPF